MIAAVILESILFLQPRFNFLRFDLAVNGGGGVTLQFQRSPLKATTKTLHLPWNQIVVIDPVVMMPYASGSAGISWDEQDTSNRVSKLLF